MSPFSSSRSSNLIVILPTVAISAAVVCFAIQCWRSAKQLEKELGELQNRVTPLNQDATTTTFTMEEIGRLHTPFPQRAGCPRQGTLAPHVRSRLILSTSTSIEMVDGLKEYSHLWIIFQFHLNPQGKASTGRRGQSAFKNAKIRPPRAQGRKLGVLATRSPHRPNPVGLSLGLLEDVQVIKGAGGRQQVCLILRGLDLVDNTPVFDIKPYVPWDRIESLLPSTSNELLVKMTHVCTPSWVSDNDELAQVKWTEPARSSLCKHANKLAPLYESVDEAVAAISEIVAQDPRALHDGRGNSSSSIDFDFTFGELRISFRVSDEIAMITQASVDEGEWEASPGSYPHNLALRRLAEARARESGKNLIWAHPVREGDTKSLFDLQGGGQYRGISLQ